RPVAQARDGRVGQRLLPDRGSGGSPPSIRSRQGAGDRWRAGGREIALSAAPGTAESGVTVLTRGKVEHRSFRNRLGILGRAPSWPSAISYLPASRYRKVIRTRSATEYPTPSSTPISPPSRRRAAASRPW